MHLSDLYRPLARHGRILLRSMLLCAGVMSAQIAHAVPSYARQTGADCASCHVGGYGPQLTPYGIRFKIGGYTDGKDGKVPISAMLVGNWTRTAKDAAEGDRIERHGANNNSAMQEASLFLAGRLTNNLGAFIQATFSGIERRSSLDQLDVRYARTIDLAGKETTVGLSVNTNPTLTDPFNTLGQWRFPYTSSDFNAGLGPSPIVEGLGGGVLGANAYAFYDNHVYAEFGLYNSLSRRALDTLHTEDVGKFKGAGSYGRLAWFQDRKRDNLHVGLIGFSTAIQPDRADLGTADRYRDLGIDAGYQFLGNREHIFTVNASYMKEWQKLAYTISRIDEAANASNSLKQFRLAGSYHYRQTWGATAGVFDTRGTVDTTIFGTSLNGRPDTRGYLLQADWTPWGKEASWGAPWANLRLGAQYTGYNRFMGGSTYLDGDANLRRARDNNTLMLFVWTSI